MAAGRLGLFVQQNVPVLLGCVFLMGLHSTLFGPVKFAYLPQHLNERELTGGNGMVEMGTFVAILLGNVAGGLLIAMPETGARYVAWACVGWPCWAACWRRRCRCRRPPTRAGHQLEPLHRDLAQPEAGARQRGGVPLAAGHQLDVVLRRRVPEPVPELCARRAARQRAGGLAAAGGVLHRHRHRCAAVRDAQPPPRGDRPGAAGRHRHDGVRGRPVLRVARPAGAAGSADAGQFLGQPAHWRVLADLACCRCSPASTACRCTR
jgi:hypothetical protein